MEDKPDWIRRVEACMDAADRIQAEIEELEEREAAEEAAFMTSWYGE